MKSHAEFGILPSAIAILKDCGNKTFQDLEDFYEYSGTVKSMQDWEFRAHANLVKRYFDNNPSCSDESKAFTEQFFVMEFQRRNIEIEFEIE